MTDRIRQITAFCAKRYNENRATRPALAKAHMAIINTAHDLRLSALDPERDMLDFLSKPHSDLELVKACKEVLEHIGGTRGVGRAAR